MLTFWGNIFNFVTEFKKKHLRISKVLIFFYFSFLDYLLDALHQDNNFCTFLVVEKRVSVEQKERKENRLTFFIKLTV